MNNLILLLAFATFLLVLAILIGQQPIEVKPCEKYGKVKAQVILVEKDKIIFMCGEE